MMLDPFNPVGTRLTVEGVEWIIVVPTISVTNEHVFHLGVTEDSDVVRLVMVPRAKKKTEAT